MFSWRVVYSDDTTLSQFDSVEHNYLEIDRNKVCAIQLVDSEKVVFSMPLEKEQQFFIRQRVALDLTGNEKRRVWIVGWRQKKVLSTVMQVNFVFSDRHVETLSRFHPEHKLYYPINFLPCEEV